MSIESPSPFLERDEDSQPDYGRAEGVEKYKKNLAKSQARQNRADKESNQPKPSLIDDARYKAVKKKYGPPETK